MATLSEYGGKIISVDGVRVVEMRDPNDNAKRRHQYRVGEDRRLERRVLRADGGPFADTGSPWQPLTDSEFAELRGARGQWHPILDSLGIS